MKYLILFLLISTTFAAQAQTNVEDYGSFSALRVSGNLEVTLIPGREAGLNVIRDHEKMKIQRSGNQLKISVDKIGQLFGKDDHTAKVEVYYTQLTEVHASAGANVTHRGTMQFNTMEMKFGSGAMGSMEVEGTQLLARTGEGAILKLSGTVENLEARSSTGGHLQASDLEARDVEAQASTGGMASLNATRSIKAVADTGGGITYHGNPEKYDTKESLGGSVKGN